MQRSGLGRSARVSRAVASQPMIDSYRSARCSGSRFSCQCTTAKAVSMTGLRASRRISGRLCSASSRSRQCDSACAGLS